MNYNVLVFVEIIEPGKAPDVKYISIGSSHHQPDYDFELSAINYIRSNPNISTAARLTCKGVHKFNTQADYITFLQNQLSDYLESVRK